MIHARFGVPAIALAATIAVASAQAQTQTASPEPTVWDHNGSVMYLVANGSSREIYYQAPSRNVGGRRAFRLPSIPR